MRDIRQRLCPAAAALPDYSDLDGEWLVDLQAAMQVDQEIADRTKTG